MAEAREIAYESGIIPLQQLVAAELSEQLLADFDGEDQARVEFDLPNVRVLQEDRKVHAERLGVLVQRGVMKRSEARAEMGLPVSRDDDVYLVPRNLTEVAPADARSKPAGAKGREFESSARAVLVAPSSVNGAD